MHIRRANKEKHTHHLVLTVYRFNNVYEVLFKTQYLGKLNKRVKFHFKQWFGEKMNSSEH